MNGPRKRTIGERIYERIDTNPYLNRLFNELLRKYTRKLFKRDNDKFTDKELNDLLRFADILSKSVSVEKSGIHKIWSQQIVALLDKIYPNDYQIKFYKYMVLNTCNNLQGLKNDNSISGNMIIDTASLLDETVKLVDKEYFTVPTEPNDLFFEDQKSIFDGFAHQYFSYSAPTSLGKSYVMRIFIKQQITKNETFNYAIVVPSKALINEVRSKIIADLDTDLNKYDYRVVTSAGDLMLEQKHHFIFVMTPERLLYLLNTSSIDIDYLFIDEAHKISTKDKRGPFYYELINKISLKEKKPHVIFASPNIPNPNEYLKLIPSDDNKNAIRSTYAPVSQIKYLIDLKSGKVMVYNDYSKEYLQMGNANSRLNLSTLINMVSHDKDQNVIYCSSLRETIDLAVEFSKTQDLSSNVDLIKLSEDIKNQIHSDYFLVDLLKHGVAYHVGYLPANIRIRIEKGFKDGLIKSLFCTSTLIEGVNLPADNLFITSYKNGRPRLDDVSFRNLIGRVGRIDHSLFGNVFMVNLPTAKEDTIKEYQDLLENEIKPQKLSIETALTKNQKNIILSSLLEGDFEMKRKPDKTSETEFVFMRKMALILINDIKNDQNSIVKNTFQELSDETIIEKIKDKFSDYPINTSIDISPDQHKNIREFVEEGNEYPPLKIDGSFDYDSIIDFLTRLGNAFKWKIYEHNTLGHYDLGDTEYTHIRWYSNLLMNWMAGYGLNYIIKKAIEYKEKNPYTGVWSNNRKVEDYYNRNDLNHKNLVIADTLYTIENTILFSVANYFREFSTEYKLFHKVDFIPNDWYEYVEYGTTNKLTITLQRVGYSRESANHIIQHKDVFINQSISTSSSDFVLHLNKLMESKNIGVKMETEEVCKNTPELFID